MESILKTPVIQTDEKLVASGIIWNFIQMIVNQAFAFGLKLVLAKLLFPSQFGIVGMAVVFTGFVQVLNDLGVGAALVQRKVEHLRVEHYHTAFWVGVCWSVCLYLIMSLGIAQIAAIFYQEPMLRHIIPVLSIGILFSPVNLVHKAQLIKQMNFKKLAFIDNTSNILAGSISLIMALMGAGIWALVFNSVATVLFAIPLFFNATKWKPAFIIEKQAFKDVFGFGVYTTGSNILNYLYNNVDYLLIGKLLGATSLGIYTLAFVLTDIFRSRMMAVVNNVMYPIYGKKQNEPALLKRYYLNVILLNCLFVFPIMVYFIVIGDQFVVNIFGEKWRGTVIPLQILSFSVMLHILVSGNTALLRGLGKPSLEMKQQVLKALIFLPSLVIGVYYYGIIGAAWAILFNKVGVVLFAKYTFNYLIPVKITFFEFFAAIKAPVIGAAITALIMYFFKWIGVNYVVIGMLSCLIYAGVIWLFMKEELLSFYKSFRKN